MAHLEPHMASRARVRAHAPLNVTPNLPTFHPTCSSDGQLKRLQESWNRQATADIDEVQLVVVRQLRHCWGTADCSTSHVILGIALPPAPCDRLLY